MKDKYFTSNFYEPDFRPIVTACGFSGKKTAWISINVKGKTVSGQVCKSLVKRIIRETT